MAEENNVSDEDKKTRLSLSIGVDFDQLTYGELRKFMQLTKDWPDNEFVGKKYDEQTDLEGFIAYFDPNEVES